jgi:hypothetical protein
MVLEQEPAGPELFPRIAAAGAPAPEIGDETDVLLLQEAEGIAAVAASVEDQGEGLRAMHPADLFHRGGEGPGERVVEGLGEEEQHPSPGVVEIDIGVPLHRQTALGIPAARRGVLAAVG